MILAWLILLPAAGVRAASAAPTPELNPICWEQKACEKTRITLGGGAGKEGWLENQEPCKKEGWGMCLPAGKTVTEISFGGSKNFENIGVFILTIYKYAVGVASILATIMIIISGAQWATSGGNTETINNSKKRIAGAVIGLFIALMSNFILNSINPALVNLRLPQTYLIRTMVLGAEFCEDMSSSSQFAFAAGIGETADKSQYAKKTQWGTLSQIKDEDKKCGNQWFIKDGNGTTCASSFCPGREQAAKVCARSSANQNLYECKEGNIYVKVTAGYLVKPDCKTELLNFKGFVYPFITVGAIEHAGTISVCNDGHWGYITDANRIIDVADETKLLQTARVIIPKGTLDNLENVCKPYGGVGGVVMAWAFNKSCKVSSWEVHVIGAGGADLGDITKINKFESPIPYADVKKGTVINIDVANVSRSD